MNWMVWISALFAALAGMLGFDTSGSECPPPGPVPNVVSFYYGHTGSSTYEIYSYEVAVNEETGETEIRYELMCGYDTFTFPADAEFMQKLALLADEYELSTWDGFGGYDTMIMDGSGFNLEIVFDGDTRISASGSNCGPEGEGDAHSAINELFRDHLREHGIKPEEYF